MANASIIGVTPQHVKRIDPDITVDELGNVVWTPCLLDYNADVFYRGKTVTNDEFNTLFLRQLYQGNYTTDSLVELLKEHLGTAIHRKFTNTYKLVNSYVQTFTSDAWGEAHEDGYYYITIPASVHGFEPLGGPELERMNIDVELYLLNTDGRFYEIDQMYVDPDNTVTIYTDDANVIGFVVIRTNERSYSLAAGDIHAEQVRGLAKVGLTGLYSDLHGLPNLTGIATNAENIDKILSGELVVEDANYAKSVTDSINNIPITNIFEEGSSVVKRATDAFNYTPDGTIATAFNDLTTLINTNYTTLDLKINNTTQELNKTLQDLNKTLQDTAQELNNNINTRRMLEELLWEYTGGLSSSWSGGTATLSKTWTGYDYIVIEFALYNMTSTVIYREYFTFKGAISNTTEFTLSRAWTNTTNNICRIASRSFTIENNSFIFKQGVLCEVKGTSTPAVQNFYCVPRAIYGGYY